MEVVAMLGGQVEQIDASSSFAGLVEAQSIIQSYEIARNLHAIGEQHGDIFSPKLAKLLDHGITISDQAYQEAMTLRNGAINYFVSFFNDFDAILTPAAPGEAPLFSEGITGDPIFSTVWTLCGLPCVTIPALMSQNNMPIGVQLVAGQEEDDRLLRTANWVIDRLNAGQ
jgi:Asp-tRNA(Asn)/Glu-tRNA(Gln) amidotransferase A subunit family amidase